ncbi:MAG: apolipoprotein N-acyltransferase [Deltaproteobacteria bacterium]|nr:apolipoprotein N-acyltransferase [Deltaproteobacteria bacterium]
MPLLLVLPRQSLWGAFRLAWLAGVAVNLGLCPWFPQLLSRFAGLHPVLAVLATLAIAVYQGLGWALWGVVTRAWSSVVPMALLAPAAMVVVERGMPMVFPYSLGLTQYQLLTVAQVGELGGPYVVTFLTIMVGAVVVMVITARRGAESLPWGTLAVAGGVLIATAVFGHWRLSGLAEARAEAPTMRVGLVQGAAVQTGWRASLEQDGVLLTRYQELSRQLEQRGEPLDLLLWSEKAYPLLLRHDAAHDYQEGSPRRIRRGFDSPLVFGVTSVDVASRDIHNSAAFLDRGGRLSVSYDKVRLIFFSEWLPDIMAGWFSGKRYQPGTRLQPLVVPLAEQAERPARQVPITVFICFEAIFPDHVRKLMSHQPELLINLSDDSWFGDSLEPEQHLAHAVFRAIESRRDLVRAAGSGISAFITASGELQQRGELNEPGRPFFRLLADDVRLLRQPSLYATFGDGFCAWCVVVVLVVGVSRLRRKWPPAPQA